MWRMWRMWHESEDRLAGGMVSNAEGLEKRNQVNDWCNTHAEFHSVEILVLSTSMFSIVMKWQKAAESFCIAIAAWRCFN